MRTAIALLLVLPLVACEPEGVMERSGEALDEVGDDVADTIEDTREDVEEDIEEVAD